MEERVPLMKRLDLFIFAKLDAFRQTSEYSKILDLYNSLDDEKQKLAKWAMLLLTAIIPLMLIGFLYLQNNSLENELELRSSLVERMQQIIAESATVGEISGVLASPTAITTQDELNSRLTSVLSSSGVDLSKVSVNNFDSAEVSPILQKSEADFRFTGLSTSQLSTMFSSLLRNERMRIATVDINRNPQTNLLDGTFHGVHYGTIQIAQE